MRTYEAARSGITLTYKSYLPLFILACLLTGLDRPAFAQSAIMGPGHTAYNCIDWDGDGYGVGPGCLGPDADDNDASVQTGAQLIAKHGGTLASAINYLEGYTPNNIWYMATTGNDSTCAANNVALPCATWGGVWSKHAAGDAIVIRGGTYNNASSMNMGGSNPTSTNPDIIMSYPGELAVLNTTTASQYGLYASDGPVTNTILDGIKIENTSEPGGGQVYLDSMPINWSTSSAITNITIRNCELRDGMRGIWLIATMTNVLIERNVIHDQWAADGSGEHNIYMGVNTADASPTAASNVVIQNNVLYNAARDNIHFNGTCTSCTVQGNVMYSANMVSGGGSANLTFQDGWNHGLVQNNIIFNSSAYGFLIDNYTDSTGCCVPHPENYNVIRNNTIIHSGYDATGQNLSGDAFTAVAVMNESASTEDMGHNTWDNNILWDMGTSVDAIVRYQMLSGDANWLSTDIWRNNIMYASGGAAPLSIGTGYVPPQQNWSYFSSSAATFTNNSQANPLLQAANATWYNAPQNWNLATQAGSPAIGAGLPADAPAADITGKSRGSSPDIGAYQSTGGTTAPAPSKVTIATTTLPNGTAGTAYAQTLAASGGTAPYSWSLTAGSLPAGLVLSVAGTISGTPTAAAAATFTVQVLDSSGLTASGTLSLSVAAAPAALSSLSCASSSLSSKSSGTCTVALSAAAASGGVAVALSSNSALLAVPGSVTVSAGAASANFTATAGTIASSQTATVTTTLNGASKSLSLTLMAPAQAPAPAPAAKLTSLACNPTSLASGASSTCTVALSGAAASGGVAVALSSNSASVAVPGSVTVAAGATAATFAAAAGTITASSTAVVTATLAGVSATANLSLQPPVSAGTAATSAELYLQGAASEVTGTTNGSTVTPTVGPAGLKGSLTVRGTGSVNFAPSNGVSFKVGGQQNQNTAFYNFTGSQVKNMFNMSQGKVSFNLKSSYSFAARQQLPQNNNRMVFDVYDNSRELFDFQVQAANGRLILYYNTGSTVNQYYYLPAGQEDSLFGAGVTLQVQLSWDGKNTSLYLNGNLVNETPYKGATANWTNNSSFTFGAGDPHSYGGGYFACDDVIGNFQTIN